jgi:hypothetical protein
MCLVIKFFNAKIIHPAKIHCQFVEMYGKSVINGGNMHKCNLLNGGRKDVRNERRSGCSSVITQDFKDRVDAHIHENRRITIDELHEFSHMFHSLSSMRLSQFNYRRMYARRVPKMLTHEHK